MIPVWWSLLLTAVGVTGWWLVGRKKKSGFVLGISAQALWIAYALATQQWGFILSAVLYGVVQTQGLRNWMKEKKMLQFVKLTEKNDHEGETWHYWLQFDGNTQELTKLKLFLEEHAGDDEDFPYELFDYTRYEDEVDILVEESDWGYMKTHQKFKGHLNLGDLSLVTPDDILYKSRIERFFE